MEIERARLTRILAKIREDDGDINAAATVLQELQVCFHSFSYETFDNFMVRMTFIRLNRPPFPDSL